MRDIWDMGCGMRDVAGGGLRGPATPERELSIQDNRIKIFTNLVDRERKETFLGQRVGNLNLLIS